MGVGVGILASAEEFVCKGLIMGAGGVTSTVVTEDTSTFTEGTCHDIARHWHRVGMCSGLPQGAQGPSRTGEIPQGCPKAGPTRGGGSVWQPRVHSWAMSSWLRVRGSMGAMGCHGDVRPWPAPILPPTVLRKCSTSSSPWRAWQGCVWVPVPVGGPWPRVPPWEGQVAAARG